MRVSKNNVVYTMSANNEPVFNCKSGEKLIFETKDCFSDQINDDKDIEKLNLAEVNPATGPVAVDDAKVGDVLKIYIKKIEIAERGVIVTAPGMGILGDLIEKTEIKIIPIKERKAIFNEKVEIPIKPMIGVIGLAPEKGSISCGIPGHHGGNMDNKIITEGSILYLPVNVNGAMLAVGDLHAVMGDGEVVGCGIEIAGEVTLEIEVLKEIDMSEPFLVTKNYIYTIASADSLDEASEQAVNNMYIFLKRRLSLEDSKIAMLMSIICDLQICQVVNPRKTVRMSLNRKLLKKYELRI